MYTTNLVNITPTLQSIRYDNIDKKNDFVLKVFDFIRHVFCCSPTLQNPHVFLNTT